MIYNKDHWNIEYKDNDKTTVAILKPKTISVKYIVKCRYSKNSSTKQKWFKIENGKRLKFTDSEFMKSFNEQIESDISKSSNKSKSSPDF
ncbi:MAG: hypothetical protein LBE13_22330 [Bacteroidales bacterium]|jgi:hypothetical protein|nr:hypothetical protein [Bacteroidales bacterium]